MPYDNETGKLNWWALAAIITPIIMTITLTALWSLRDVDRELLRTMIKQVSDTQAKFEQQNKDLYQEIKINNEKQDKAIAELKDSYKMLCWAISMPFEQRKHQFNLTIPYEGKGDAK